MTYIPLAHGFVYLVAIMDGYSRRVLSWRVSTTQDVQCSLEALEEAMAAYGKPVIFNTDQGSQFTSVQWSGALKKAGIEISMDGKGCWMDNVFMERLWRSLKYECVDLNAFDTVREAQEDINAWMRYYNAQWPHSGLNVKTPTQAYLALAA